MSNNIKLKSVNLEGQLTIKKANQIKRLLADVLSKNNKLLINLEGTKQIDLSILQLLCSAHKTAIEQNKTIALIGKVPEQAIASLKHCGLFEYISCGKDLEYCLWEDIIKHIETSPDN